MKHKSKNGIIMKSNIKDISSLFVYDGEYGQLRPDRYK